MERTDLAVVGAGVGGLVAGALAARQGLRVTVLEAHSRPGGCAGDFALEGFLFPAGATVVTGLEPGGILDAVFRALGIAIPFRPLDPSIVIHLPDRSFGYDASPSAWDQTFGDAFPTAGTGYRRFWRWAHLVGGAVGIGTLLPSLPIETFADARRTLPALRGRGPLALPFLPLTVAQVKAALGAGGDRAADAVIDSLLLDATGCTAVDASAVQGAMALDLYRRGCQWVEGGTGRLAMALVRSIRSSGGNVRFLARATGLEQVGDGWRVEVEGHSPLAARCVVANMPRAAFRDLAAMAPGPALPDSAAWGAFVLHLGVDATGLPAPHPFHQVVDPWRPPEEPGSGAFVSIFGGRGDRADRWSLSVSTHTRAGRWRQMSEQEARAERVRLEERLIAAADRVVPGVRDRLLVRRSATPRTFERYTSRPGGYVGGLRQRRGVAAIRAPGHRPAPGAFLAGDHVFPGQGTVGVALSGINAFRDAVEHIGGKPLL